MTLTTSLNTNTPHEFHYRWIAVYEDKSYLSELDEDNVQASFKDIELRRLQYFVMFSQENTFILDICSGRIYCNGHDITPPDTSEATADEIRAGLFEYRHARQGMRTEPEVYARTFGWKAAGAGIELTLSIPED